MTVDLEWLESNQATLDDDDYDWIRTGRRLVDAINKKIAEAREEQREACATWCYDCNEIGGMNCCYATPLTSTPLADRIKELERALGKVGK